ncbi:hypothetical protein [Alishewanella longhuensis]
MLQRHGLSSITVNSGGVSQNSNNNQNNLSIRGGLNSNGLQNNNIGNVANWAINNNLAAAASKRKTILILERFRATLKAFLPDGPANHGGGESASRFGNGKRDATPAGGNSQFLGQTEAHLQRQVVLEARIIEVTLVMTISRGSIGKMPYRRYVVPNLIYLPLLVWPLMSLARNWVALPR